MTPLDPAAFILAHTRLQPVSHAPEISLWLADEVTPIWQLTEEELGEMGVPPPFWAFAWAGGQALARFLLDHPDRVRGRRVLDLAAGSGLVGIAALKAAVALNAEANGVTLDFAADNLLDRDPPLVDLICAGDVFYERPMAEAVIAWLKADRAQGTEVLIGDPRRSYFPKGDLIQLAEYEVPTTRELEDQAVKRSGVYDLGS